MAASILDRTRLVKIDDSCGCSLTRSSIEGLTPETLEDMGKTEYNKARVLAEMAESRAIGAPANTMESILMGRVTEIGKGELTTEKVGYDSMILPYRKRPRKTLFNTQYFKIIAGAASPNAGSTVGGIVFPASAWKVRVTNPTSPRASALSNIAPHFRPLEYLYVENKDATGGSNFAPFKIILSEAVTGQPTQADVTIVPPYTTGGWAALSAPEKALFQPEVGVVQVGANNVANEESWCHNQVARNPFSIIIDWFQTSRYSQCHTKEYDKVLKAILAGDVNDFTRKFQYLPLAEQNRQRFQEYRQKWMNSVFYGSYISEVQTPETYADLDPILDPENSCQYGYKANALGLRTLLQNDGRVFDLKGAPLDLDFIFDQAYEVARNRAGEGGNLDTVDLMTDAKTAAVIHKVLVQYYKDNYGVDAVNTYFTKGEVMDQWKTMSMSYNHYEIPDKNVKIAIFVDTFFIDRNTMFVDDLRTRGASLWVIDWSDFRLGVFETRSSKTEFKGRIYQNANRDFACVISPNTEYYDLRSTTWTGMIDDSYRHFLVENFDNTKCPTSSLICTAADPVS